MLFYILAGLVFIALIVFLVYAARNWHWLHITAVALVFLTAVPGVYCAAYVLKTRAAVVRMHAEANRLLEERENRYLNQLYGAQPGQRGRFGEGSLKAEAARFKLLTMGKGRTWENASLQARNEDQVTFDVPLAAAPPADDQPGVAAEQPAAAAGADQETTGLYPSIGSMIYAFQVTGFAVDENRQVAVPGKYMGAYRVTAINGTQVVTTAETILPTETRAGDSVILFEKPPTDSHSVMNAALGFADGSTPSIDEMRQKFQEVFPPDTFELDANSPHYQRMVDEFAFDGRPLTEIDQWLNAQGRPNLNPSPEEIVAVVRAQRNLEESVDGTQDMVTSGIFDSLGRANDPELQLGRSARIAAAREGDQDDVLLLDEPTAALGYTRPDGTQIRSWEEDGKGDVVSRRYNRQLRDYTGEIEQILFDIALMDQRIAEYNFLNSTTQQVLADATTQQNVRDAKISALTQDQQNLRSDLRLIEGYAENLESRLAQLRNEIRDNYLRIAYLHQQAVEEAQTWQQLRAK